MYITTVRLKLRKNGITDRIPFNVSLNCEDPRTLLTDTSNSINFYWPEDLTDTFEVYSFTMPPNFCDLSKNTLGSFAITTNRAGNPGYAQIAATDSPTLPYFGVGDLGGDQTHQIWIQVEAEPAPLEKTPILIIPGVLGTEIFKDQTRLWASVLRMADPVNSDNFMDPLIFSTNLESIDPNIFLGSIISNPDHLFDYSEGLINEFSTQGYQENKNLFTFPYDWRYGASGKLADGSTISDQLAQKIQDIMKQTGSDKVDIIAHSTGGLLIKKYVMEHAADHHIGKIVFVGVPNLGAPKAVKVLLSGDNFGVLGLSDEEMKKIAQNLPVVYDLAPSREYVNAAGVYFTTVDYYNQDIGNKMKLLDHDQTNQYLTSRNLVNSTAVSNADALHTADFDKFDVRNAGIDAYSIVGCKSATPDGVYFVNRRSDFFINPTDEITGDGTVPMPSANSILTNDDHKFFATKTVHSKMLSLDGTRQQIVNILSGSSLPVGNNIISQGDLNNDPSKCKLKGHWWQILSPVDAEIFDQSGNRTGIAADGSIQNDIPGADFEKWDDRKFIFLPTDAGQNYTINLTGTGTGYFSFKISDIDNSLSGKMEIYNHIPVTPKLKGTLHFSASGSSELFLDTNGDGEIDQTASPIAVLEPGQAGDQLPPETTLKFNGQAAGAVNNFSSSTAVALTAQDFPTLNPAGIYKTFYKLDNAADFSEYASGITVSGSGGHVIKYYSLDNAANDEGVKEATFSITVATSTEPEVPPADTSSSTPPGGQSDGGSGGPNIPITPVSFGGSGYILPTSTRPQVLGVSTKLTIHLDGSLIIFPDSPLVYLIEHGVKHPFYSAKDFLGWGYKFKNVELAWPGDSGLWLGIPMGHWGMYPYPK